MSILRTTTSLTLASAAVLGTGTLAASQAAAAGGRCALAVTSVFADELQEDGAGHDDIFIHVGNRWFPTYVSSTPFAEDQTKTAAQLDNPKDTGPAGTTLLLELWEDDTWPAANEPLGGKLIGLPGNCATTSPTVGEVVFSDIVDYRYVVSYTIGPA